MKQGEKIILKTAADLVSPWHLESEVNDEAAVNETFPDAENFSDEQVSRSISQVCLELVIIEKLRDGTTDYPAARDMAEASAGSDFPWKKAGA